MTLTIADPVRHTVQQIVSWFAQGFENAAESDMLAALSETEVAALAEDCGLSAHQLMALVKAGPHAADEMPAMMRALNIDPAEVEYRLRRVFRDMQITCTQCRSKDTCRNHLQQGKAERTFVEYCGNAETLNALRANPDLLIEA
ncbi:MAG: DUF6455 family protein [Rhizobium sp.]|nr:DUF6455 family protein [Rhizobium sp.]